MKKIILILIAVIGLGLFASSCSSQRCETYKSTNHYRV